jgi:glycosyltransferase involved in cell wall biosynthesis
VAVVAEGLAPMPNVSVVMPVLNGEAYLVEAIESVLGQTLEELELVVVDDGSHDTSRAIVKRFAGVDPRVRLVVNERNLGIAAALNQGWRAAQAPFIARLDADDVALPDRLSQQTAFLDAHPSVAVVGGAARVINSAGRQISTMRFPTASRTIRSTLLRHNCLAHPTVMLRRVALEDVGGYRFDHSEDYDLWLRLSERFELANLADPLILYRVHAGQLSLIDLEQRVKGALAVRAAARTRRATGNDPLNGVDKLSPEVFGRLAIDDSELSSTLEHEWLSWATVLVDLGRREEALELVDQASRTLGSRASRAFAAARELKAAEALLGGGRPVAGAAHVLLAFRREPKYAFARLRAWLADQFGGRDLLRRT